MRLTRVLLAGALTGALIGQVGFALFEHSYFHRGIVYRRWQERSAGRRT